MKKPFNYERFTEVAAEMDLDCIVLYDENQVICGVIIGDEEFIEDFADELSKNKGGLQ